MIKHNYFVKILSKINNSINSLLKKNLNKLNFIFEKDILLTFFSFKTIFVFFLVLLFSIFSYLSIPYLYNNNKVVANIKNHLSKNLNLDFNLSNNFSYNIFPKPNFKFEGSSFLNQIENSGQVMVYISPKYLLFPSKIKVKDIVFNKMNFNLDKDNYDFFIKILKNDFSNFTLKIKDSNIFYNNIENDVLFINKIKQLKYFYDTRNFENILLADNEIFNIPYKIEIRDDASKKEIISKLNFDFIDLIIENNLNYKDFEKNGLIKLTHNKKKSEGVYSFTKNFFKFDFFDKSLEKNFHYNGFINLRPFFSELSGEVNKMNLGVLLKSNSILVQFLKTGIFNSKNLNINAKINSKQTSSFRDLINLILNINISEGLVDINDTKFSLKNYADFKISNSLIYTNENNLVLDALISINIKDIDKVYKIFQTPRNNRKEIKKIEFNLNYNFDQLSADFNDIKINNKINEKVNKTLNQINLKENNLQNRIYIKNLVNQVIKNYAG